MLLVATILNYVDRSALALLRRASEEPALESCRWASCLRIRPCHSIALVPGGVLTDILGSRLAYALSLVGWSFATLTQGLATAITCCFGSRLAIGALEAPAFPSNARAVTLWFPAGERGFRDQRLRDGAIHRTPLFHRLVAVDLRRVRLAYGLFRDGRLRHSVQSLWYRVYRDPLQHAGVNAAELQYINEGATAARKPREKFDWRMALKLLSYRQISRHLPRQVLQQHPAGLLHQRGS